MTQAVSTETTEQVCERCGYVLTGLSADGNCPECGQPLAESAPALRRLPPWETQPRGMRTWMQTSAEVIFHPSRFFRTLATRVSGRPSASFASIHYWIISVLFGLAASCHLQVLLAMAFRRPPRIALTTLGFVIFAYGSIRVLNWLAAYLTYWEARYRTMRIPLGVARRGLDYHSPHYLPVAVAALLTTGGYLLLRRVHALSIGDDITYLYVLCAEVFVAAAYLFYTYWIAMRNMMYANR